MMNQDEFLHYRRISATVRLCLTAWLEAGNVYPAISQGESRKIINSAGFAESRISRIIASYHSHFLSIPYIPA